MMSQCEAPSMSIHNVCFHGETRKIFSLSLLSGDMFLLYKVTL